MNKHLFKLVLYAFLCLPCMFEVSFAQNRDFETANKYYEQGDFQSAITMYLKIENSDLESPALYYNLGNAYFKSGDLGRALLYYYRAKRLDPSDVDIQNNLTFAARFSTMQMEGVELNPIEAFLKSLVGGYRLKTFGWLASGFFVLLVGLLILKFGLQYYFAGLNSCITVVLVLLMISSGLTTFKYRSEFLIKRAVVIAQETTVYSGPSSNSDREFEGSPGLVVEIVRESGEYYDVIFENKRRGWIKRDQVAVI